MSNEARTWCNLCNLAFKSLEVLQQHMKENMGKHQDILDKGGPRLRRASEMSDYHSEDCGCPICLPIDPHPEVMPAVPAREPECGCGHERDLHVNGICGIAGCQCVRLDWYVRELEATIADQYGFRLIRERQFWRSMWRGPDAKWYPGAAIPELVWEALLKERARVSQLEQELAQERNYSNCDKLDRERQTKHDALLTKMWNRRWREALSLARAALAQGKETK